MTTSGNGAGARDRRRRARRERPPLPRRPYRDSALLHAVLAVVIVGVTLLTAGSVVTGVVVAAGYFVAATAWSWMRFHQRARDEARAARERGRGPA